MQQIYTKMYYVSVCFVNIEAVKTKLHLRGSKYFYLYFPYLFSDFGENRYNRSAHNAV